MMEKVKLTQEQADAIETLKEKAKGMLVVDVLEALKNGYEVYEEYKVRDWVVKKETNRIAKITKIVNGYMVYGHWNNQDMEKWNYKHEIRHATPEEIKAEQERRVWSGIGREVGEFEDNDIGWDKAGNIRDGKPDLEHYYSIGRLKGFYPAESFISLGGEEY